MINTCQVKGSDPRNTTRRSRYARVCERANIVAPLESSKTTTRKRMTTTIGLDSPDLLGGKKGGKGAFCKQLTSTWSQGPYQHDIPRPSQISILRGFVGIFPMGKR